MGYKYKYYIIGNKEYLEDLDNGIKTVYKIGNFVCDIFNKELLDKYTSERILKYVLKGEYNNILNGTADVKSEQIELRKGKERKFEYCLVYYSNYVDNLVRIALCLYSKNKSLKMKVCSVCRELYIESEGKDGMCGLCCGLSDLDRRQLVRNEDMLDLLHFGILGFLKKKQNTFEAEFINECISDAITKYSQSYIQQRRNYKSSNLLNTKFMGWLISQERQYRIAFCNSSNKCKGE